MEEILMSNAPLYPYASTEDEDDDGTIIQPTKKVRYTSPDVVVSVGSGESMREFQCYGSFLSYASPVLDAMLSSRMKEGQTGRIEFPNKDPEEWNLFYEFISPAHPSDITNDNVLILLPYFHEFEVNHQWVDKCDEHLAKNYFATKNLYNFFDKTRQANETSDAEYNSRLGQRKNEVDMIFHVLQLARLYELKAAKSAMEFYISGLLTCLQETSDLFDLSKVKTILELLRPLELNDAPLDLIMNSGGGNAHHRLRSECKKILSTHINDLSQEIIDHDDHFALFFHMCIKIKLERDRVKAEKGKTKAAKSIIKTLIDNVPNEEMPATLRKKYMDIVSAHHNDKHKGHFKKIGMSLPPIYSAPR